MYLLPSSNGRQGDPLSSYIFILYMEFLAFHIMESCASGEWHPIKAGQSGSKFSHLFLQTILFFFQCWSNSQDTRYWLDSPNGEFNFKSTYKLESNSCGQPSHFAGGKWLWKVFSLPKVKYFIWLCLHNSLSVREVLASRGLNITHLCPRCGTHAESILHLLRDCCDSCAFWQKIGIPTSCISSFKASLYDWLHANYTNQFKKPPHNLL